LNKYKQEQKDLKIAYKQLDSLYKLNKALAVKNVKVDESALGSDSLKIEKNKQFLNRLKTDIYLDESIKVINTMIKQGSVVMNKSIEAKLNN
jgi:carboxyl-terminal processing protease